MERYQLILRFWFGDGNTDDERLGQQDRWWEAGPELDAVIRRRFGQDLEWARSGHYDAWRDQPEPCLAFILLLDQFSRQVYRGTPWAFAQDPAALATCLDGRQQGLDRELTPVQRWFFYMPMMHAEDLDVQQRSVRTFRALADEQPPGAVREALEGAWRFAVRHRDVIEQFGRFPHRNQVLRRPSTEAEERFLTEVGRGF